MLSPEDDRGKSIPRLHTWRGGLALHEHPESRLGQRAGWAVVEGQQQTEAQGDGGGWTQIPAGVARSQ